MLKKIYLIDNSPQLTSAWTHDFSNYDTIEVIRGDYFIQKADAIISPANSFGIMDGGLDLAIRYELGFDVEEKLQKEIVSQFHGELPVGSAIVISTNHSDWPFMIGAPTMRVPEDISQTTNPYIAFRAILLAIKNHNQIASNKINSIVCSGLGTGIGRVEPQKCSMQMKLAYEEFINPAKIPTAQKIHRFHKKLNMNL